MNAVSLSRAAFVLTASLWLAGLRPAQAGEGAPLERAAILQAAQRIMEKTRYCALVTVGLDGQPQARVVDPFAPEPDLVVWIATNPVTRKVAQIRRDPRVTLIYVDPAGGGYVTLLGSAEAVDAPAEKQRRWKKEWASFYRDENRGDDYLLLRVRPSRLEIVSYADGIVNDPESWVPVSLSFP